MPDDSKVILVDGPMAGHLQTVPVNTYSWAVRVPPVPTLFCDADPLKMPFGNTAYYRIGECVFRGIDDGFSLHRCRIGYTAAEPPGEPVLAEYVPTALAEQGLWPWELVQRTARDHAEPVEILAVGDAAKDCTVRFCDPWFGFIDASCECGWYTDRLPPDRRSQVVRAAHLHWTDAPRRRRLLAEPIRTLSFGGGVHGDCFGGIATDQEPGPLYGTSGLIYGTCRRCGWETERVEAFRHGRLWQACQAHAGPDGVRRMKNLMRAKLGEPLLPKLDPQDEVAAMLWRRLVAEPAAEFWRQREHDDEQCAVSHSDNPTDSWRCVNGEVYGMCGHPNCYGACDWQAACACRCHRPGPGGGEDA